jgi:hypothetical protein
MFSDTNWRMFGYNSGATPVEVGGTFKSTSRITHSGAADRGFLGSPIPRKSARIVSGQNGERQKIPNLKGEKHDCNTEES